MSNQLLQEMHPKGCARSTFLSLILRSGIILVFDIADLLDPGENRSRESTIFQSGREKQFMEAKGRQISPVSLEMKSCAGSRQRRCWSVAKGTAHDSCA